MSAAEKLLFSMAIVLTAATVTLIISAGIWALSRTAHVEECAPTLAAKAQELTEAK